MKKTVLFALVALLMAPSAFCIKCRLRLERAATLDGEWVDVPANTIPITAEGDFEDSLQSDTAFYRMRIDSVSEEGPPVSIRLEDVDETARKIAQDLLESMRNMEGRDGFGNAVLGPVAYLMYRPDIDGPAYIEFAALSPQPEPPDLPSPTECDPNRGYILVSLTRDDFPVLEFATQGPTRTEYLRRRAKSSSIRVFRYGNFMAGENEKGELVASLGAPPVRFSEKALDYIGQTFESHIVVDPQGKVEDIGDQPDLSAEPYKSYEELRDDFVNSQYFQIARDQRREHAKAAWDVYLDVEPKTINVILGFETTFFEDREVKEYSLEDPDLASIKILNLGLLIAGQKVGKCGLSVVFADEQKAEFILVVSEQGTLSVEQPLCWNDWSYHWAGSWADQRRYQQLWGGSCWSGCGATAWAMLYGWFDFLGRCELIAGGPAPVHSDANVEDCTWAVVEDIGTVCVTDQGFTWPHDMWDGRLWGEEHGCSYYCDMAWTSTCIYSETARDWAIRAIRDRDVPVIVGLGCEFHYPLAYGYATRRCRSWGVTWWRDHFFAVNDGHRNDSRIWKNGWITWIAVNAAFETFH